MSESKDFSVLLLEHDVHEDCLPVWSFPSVSAEISHLACARCALPSSQETPFLYFKYKSDWVYCLTLPVTFPSVRAASLCVVCRNWNPEKWNAVLQVLFEQYSSSTNSDPTKILEGYLSITTTGHFSNAAGTVALSSYSDANVAAHVNVLKELVVALGVEAVVLWNAVLLRKRVLVVSDTIARLLPVMRTLPLLSTAAASSSALLRPLVSSEELHIEDLVQTGVWIAGTLDASMLQSQAALYDVVLTLSPERRVTVASHAAAELKMCSVHREVASLLTELAESEGCSGAQLVTALHAKVAELLAQLKSMSAGGALTEEAINSKVSNQSTQQWLLRLANAEGLL